jgi:hypothetical protein
VAKDLQRAIDASVKASEAHTHLDQRMYMSAKHLESAAFFAKDLKRPDEAARLYEEAASFHQVRARASVSVSVSVRVRVRVSVSVGVRVRAAVRGGRELPPDGRRVRRRRRGPCQGREGARGPRQRARRQALG